MGVLPRHERQPMREDDWRNSEQMHSLGERMAVVSVQLHPQHIFLSSDCWSCPRVCISSEAKVTQSNGLLSTVAIWILEFARLWLG